MLFLRTLKLLVFFFIVQSLIVTNGKASLNNYVLNCKFSGKFNALDARSSNTSYDKRYSGEQSHIYSNYSMSFGDKKILSHLYQHYGSNIKWRYYDEFNGQLLELKYFYFPKTKKINLSIRQPNSKNIWDIWGNCVKKIINVENPIFKSNSLANYDDDVICFNATKTRFDSKFWHDDNKIFVSEAKSRGLDCGVNENNKTVIASKSKSTESSISLTELENEKQKRKSLEQKITFLEQEKQKRIELEKKLAALQSEKKKQIKKAKQNEIGSGFYVSKFRHIVTNQHVVNQCKKITVGDGITKQIPSTLVASDKRNDLAILQTISMEMASADTKSFIQNLSIEIVPIISGGLIRAEDVVGGEEIFVAGYPLGSMVSDSMRLVPGLVNATKGYENDITQFETDASIKKGNSGGPIYDKKGNIVGVAVKRLNVSQSDNFNFAIKGTTVKQFLDANGVITSLANRKSQMSSTDIYKIASKQTVMVVCHR